MKLRLSLIIFFISLNLFNTSVWSQTLSDSLYLNSIFSTNLYFSENFLSKNWFNIPSVTSVADLEQKISYIYKFKDSAYFNSYNSITIVDTFKENIINSTFNSIYPTSYYKLKNIDACKSISFKLNNTIDTTHFIFTSLNNPINATKKTAFLIIPGSGANQSYITAWGTGYNASHCDLNNYLSSYGDVFVLTKNNEDYRAIRYNNKKLNIQYLEAYLQGLNKNSGINYVIQAIALVKHLKSKYNKVLIMGLSEGGFASMLTGIESSPDGVISSSGYSILYDSDSYFTQEFTRVFGEPFIYLKRSKIKERILNNKSLFMLSYGINEGIPILNTENLYDSTFNYLNSNNVSLEKNFNGHAYPNCADIDSFYNLVMKTPQPKMFLTAGCNQDSTKLIVKFKGGNPPYSFNLFKNGLYFQSFVTSTDSIVISLTQEGLYECRNLNTNLYSGLNSDTIRYTKFPRPIITNISNLYNCDSLTNLLSVTFNKNSILNFTYSINNTPHSVNNISGLYTTNINNGIVKFISVTDSNFCFTPLSNDSITLTNNQVNFQTLLTSKYSCDSNSYKYDFKLSGKSPWKLYYNKNGQNSIYQTSDTLNTLYLNNGTYFFYSVSDSNNCTININNLKNVSYIPLSFNLLQPQFNCDSSKTKLSINLQGNAPFKIFYRRNGVSQSVLTTANLYNFYFTNATYAFDSIKDATCKVNFPANTVYTFNDVIPNLSVAYNSYICDSAKSAINLSPTGKAPFTVQYTNGTQFFSANIQNATTLNLSNGTYYFSKITDSNGCIKTLNQNLVLQTQPLQAMLSAPVYVCDSVKTKFVIQTSGTPPFKLFYKKNGIPQQLTYASNSFTFYLGNGDYTFDSVKDVNCTFIFSNIPPYYFSYNALTANIANPVFSCDSNAFKINFNFTGQAPFIVNYLQNGVQMQFVSNTSTYNFYATAGIYNIQEVIDANGCVKNIQQIIPIQYQTLNYSINNPVYNCDSNKSEIALHLQGNGPWTIFYRKNNISHSLVSNTNTINLFVNNGIYLFDSVKDIHCTKPMSINNSFSINIDSLQVNFSSPYYNCVSNATYLPINMSGTAPFKLYYFQNGFFQTQLFNTNFTELLLNNAQYIFTSISDVYCTKYIQQNYSIQNYPLAMNYSPPVYVCDSNKTKLHVEFEGNGPWKLYYRFNNAYYQYNTSNFSADIFFGNGNLFIDSCSDATCTLAFNTPIQFNFNYNPLNALLFSSSFNCDSNKTALPIQLSGNPPFTLAYTRNNINYQLFLNNPSQTLMLQNGLYNFTSVTDATQCIHAINQTYQYNYDSLIYSWSSPTFICDSNKAKINFDFQGNPPFTVYFHKNGIADSFQTNALHHTAYFSNGNYIIDAIRDITCYQALVTNNTFTINYSTLQTNIASPVYDCAQQVVGVDMQLQGNAPWTIHYFKTGVPPQFFTYTTYNPSYTALFGNGNYVIDSISDISNCIKQINMYVHNEYSPLNILKTNSVYNCDSNKIQINYQLYGDAPWTIQYRDLNSNSIHQVVSYYNTYSLFLQSGDYVVEQVTDYKCTQILNDSLHFAIPKLISSISSEAVSCDSNKMYVVINTPSGVSPYHIKYFENNILKYRISSNNTDTFYLNNGSFFFEKITDALGCEIIFNRNVIADYNPFYFQQLQTSYSCEKDSTLLKVAIQHATPIYFEYYQDNILRNITLQQNSAHEWYLPNGDYYFSRIYDQIGCVKLLQDSLQINEHPIQYKDSIGINCDARTYQYYITLQGKSPWYLAYNVNNKLNTVSFDSTYAVWNVPYGNYYLIDITDNNGCKQSIRREDTLQKFLMSNPVISYDNQWIYGPDFPYTYTWTRDNVVLPKVHDHKIRPYGNGTYVLTIHDSTGCSYPSNAIQINLPKEIVVYPIPTSETLHVLVNYTFGEYWEYKIFDITGKLLTKDIVNKPFEAIPVAHLAKGIYQLVIQQENDLSTARHIIRFVKE